MKVLYDRAEDYRVASTGPPSIEGGMRAAGGFYCGGGNASTGPPSIEGGMDLDEGKLDVLAVLQRGRPQLRAE